MLLTNHALTGVWLGSVIELPELTYPAGVISHLVLDSTPHGSWLPGPFIHPRPRRDPVGMSGFKTPLGFVMGSLDFACALSILGISLYAFPERRASTAAGWLGAVTPDLLYIPEIFFKRRFFPRFKKFHHDIQWSESGYGIVTEVFWAGLMLRLLHLL